MFYLGFILVAVFYLIAIRIACDWASHGFHFHNLRLGVGKWSVYDHDIRVPMLVSGEFTVKLMDFVM